MQKAFACLAVLLLLGAASCIVVDNPHPKLAPGKWRASLELVSSVPNLVQTSEGTQQIEEFTEGELPFLFEVVYDTDSTFHIEIINGEERIPVYDIQTGTVRATAKDTIRIDFPIYQSYITAFYEEDVIEGEWVVTTRDNYRIPFVARQGRDYRFTTLRKEPVMDLSGRWQTTFGLDTDDPYPAIGEFQQDGNSLRGTFLTETGDYRYLAGTVQADKLYLSTFDGSHAFLFEGKILPDSSLIGSFRSGKHYQVTWKARRNPNFELRDADSLTYLQEEPDWSTFTFPNTSGERIGLNHPSLRGKVKVLLIFGTWCPNCRDANRFLSKYVNENVSNDLGVIGIAFEKAQETEKAMEILQSYRQKMNIPYELLYGGYYDKEEAAQKLPMLNRLTAYPTLIILDRENQVQRIHTGFSGPATSEYDSFRRRFDQLIKDLQAENPNKND